jgi:hypothetical protein
VAVAAVALVAPYCGPVSALFGLTPLPLPLFGALLVIVVAYAAVTEGVKLVFFGWLERKGGKRDRRVRGRAVVAG